MYAHHMPGQGQFQSTHPARGATLRRRPVLPSQAISIHAPREGCDLAYLFSRWPPGNFNPRTPRGVRLSAPMSTALLCHFNPRTPRGVRRGCPSSGTHCTRYFNPRTPRGVRLSSGCSKSNSLSFQSTHPARGATANFTKEQGVCLAQFAYLHKGKKAEHTKTNAPMLH